MLVLRSANERAARASVTVPLDHKASAIARPLDTFELRAIAAEARAEWNAIRAGEKPRRIWSTLSPERLEAARTDDEEGRQLLDWMHAVLTATASVIELHGVIEADGVDAEGMPINPRPMAPCFEAFELLFLDGRAEVSFRLHAPVLERIWQMEKNASASVPNGPGAEASISAADAATPATPAPVAESETSPPDSTASATSADAAPAPPA